MKIKDILCAFFLLSTIARGQTVVADLVADYSGDPLSHGWTYLWNPQGPVGTSSGYIKLEWDADHQDGQWDVSHETWPNPADGSGFLNIRRPADMSNFLAGHPGEGTNTPTGMAAPKYVILCYTLADSGTYSITNSALASVAADSGGLQFQVYVNDTQMAKGVVAPGQTIPFDKELGGLKKADRIYVAVAPRDGTMDFKDYFTISYQIEKKNP